MTAPKPPDGVRIKSGPEAVPTLIDLWMDGMSSGLATAVRHLRPEVSDAEIVSFVEQVTVTMRADPLAMDVVDLEVRERIMGVDSGSKDFTLGWTW